MNKKTEKRILRALQREPGQYRNGVPWRESYGRLKQAKQALREAEDGWQTAIDSWARSISDEMGETKKDAKDFAQRHAIYFVELNAGASDVNLSRVADARLHEYNARDDRWSLLVWVRFAVTLAMNGCGVAPL